MRISNLLHAGAASILLCSCNHYAYVSPVNGSTTSYHTIPVKNANVASAVYANLNMQAGKANERLNDNTFNIQANAYRTNQLGYFQLHYGGGLTVGAYNVSTIPDSTGFWNYFHGVHYINERAGSKFFGTGNIQAGINLCLPFSDRPGDGEWRLGINSSLHREFGSYLSFRQGLNTDSVTGVAKSNWLSTVAVSSDLVFKAGEGYCGWMAELGYLMGNDYRDTDFSKEGTGGAPSRYKYVTNTLHYTLHRITGYAQTTWGPQVASFHVGINVQLLQKKKKPL